MSKVADLELAEKEKMKDKVAKILKNDINVFINRSVPLFLRVACYSVMYNEINYTILSSKCRQLIYNYPEQLFADAGVMAIEHADFEGVERLALVLGKCLNAFFCFATCMHASWIPPLQVVRLPPPLTALSTSNWAIVISSRRL